jgi:plastocyanin
VPSPSRRFRSRRANAVGISKPINSDGSCASTSSCQTNTGTQTLKLTADHTLLKVGESVPISASFGGMLLNGSGNYLPSTVSDSSVISASAFGASALSVGTATLTASYENSPASLSFTVEKNDDGVSAIVRTVVFAGGTTSWYPQVAKSQVGLTVEFMASAGHNLVFDHAPGVPADVPLGASATRVFTTPGSFTFSCTVHGEAGVINIAP